MESSRILKFRAWDKYKKMRKSWILSEYGGLEGNIWEHPHLLEEKP